MLNVSNCIVSVRWPCVPCGHDSWPITFSLSLSLFLPFTLRSFRLIKNAKIDRVRDFVQKFPMHHFSSRQNKWPSISFPPRCLPCRAEHLMGTYFRCSQFFFRFSRDAFCWKSPIHESLLIAYHQHLRVNSFGLIFINIYKRNASTVLSFMWATMSTEQRTVKFLNWIAPCLSRSLQLFSTFPPRFSVGLFPFPRTKCF